MGLRDRKPDTRPRVADADGAAHDPEVVTESREDVATAAHLAPDTVLSVDHEAERAHRLQGQRDKVAKLAGHLKAAQEELERLTAEYGKKGA